jgi:hypothetical protein
MELGGRVRGVRRAHSRQVRHDNPVAKLQLTHPDRSEERLQIHILSIGRERVAEHRTPAFRLLLCGLVLDDVPMLDENAALYTKNVCCDPIDRQAETGKSSVDNDELAVGYNHSGLVFQRGRYVFDEIE